MLKSLLDFDMCVNVHKHASLLCHVLCVKAESYKTGTDFTGVDYNYLFYAVCAYGQQSCLISVWPCCRALCSLLYNSLHTALWQVLVAWDLCWRAGKWRASFDWRPASFNRCLVGAQRTNSGSTLQLGIAKDFIIEYAEWCTGHNMVKLQLPSLNVCCCLCAIMCKTYSYSPPPEHSHCFKWSN